MAFGRTADHRQKKEPLANTKINSPRRPSHQWIFPAFACIEIHGPTIHVVRAALHGIFRRNKDANATRFNVFAGHTANRGQILFDWHRYQAVQLFLVSHFFRVGNDHRLVDNRCFLVLGSLRDVVRQVHWTG